MIFWCRCVHECSLIFDLRTPATSTNRLHSATSGDCNRLHPETTRPLRQRKLRCAFKIWNLL
ncbi:uncharacterized protein LOC143033293 isoform X1 [Oratosquilla oratoria]|uniref:uncharacterized protein LOC143033293 isoform X1 n=1 Tax=Oratosquilla oratoria TaxID=337810 RepID=UPI003F77276D